MYANRGTDAAEQNAHLFQGQVGGGAQGLAQDAGLFGVEFGFASGSFVQGFDVSEPFALAQQFFHHARGDAEQLGGFGAGAFSGVITGEQTLAGVEGYRCHADNYRIILTSSQQLYGYIIN